MSNYTAPQRPYIDMHHHFGRTINRYPSTGVNLPMAMARFSQTNTVASLSMPVATGSPITEGVKDIRDINEMAARARQVYPDRFPLVLGIAEVRFGERGLEELDKAMSELDLDGFVDHPPFNESSLPFIEVAAAYGGLCNLHCQTPLMGKIARTFPGLTFIVHASGEAVERFASLDNIIYEVVQYPEGRDTVWDFKELADKVGSRRIVYGGDQPYYDFRVLQQKIEQADIEEELKDRIAWGNALELIRRFRPHWEMPSGPMKAPRIYDDDQLWATHPRYTDRLKVDLVRGPAHPDTLTDSP